jgi:CRP/FNR family transcriptional regulator
VAEQYFHQVQEAVRLSFLSGFPEAALAELLAESRLVTLPAGTSTVGRSDLPQAALVIDGLIRVFMSSSEGRQVTVRYARTGATLGVVALVGGGFTPTNGQTLADTTLLVFSPVKLRSLAEDDKRVAWAMAEELNRVLMSVLEELAGNTFGTVKQKVALHILSIATAEEPAGRLLAAVSQQDLADAIGSVREVVGRTISELNRSGLVETTKSGIEVLDAAGLHEAAWSGTTRPPDLS